MFNKLAIKLLLRENIRLRKDLNKANNIILEIVDSQIHHRLPERLRSVERGTSDPTGDMNNYTFSDTPSDAYSVAIEDAKRLAREATEAYDDEESND